MNKGENNLSWLPALVRWLVFLGTWFVFYSPDLTALPVGAGAAVAATWTSLRLLPAGSFHPWPGSLFVLALRFVWQSVVAGEKAAQATVAWSAALESADAYLRRWPVACLSLSVVAIILGALMLAGR
jgi:hypothetical protein